MAALNPNTCGLCAHYETKNKGCQPMRDLVDALPPGTVPCFSDLVFSDYAQGCSQWKEQEFDHEAFAEGESYENMKRKDAAMYTPYGRVRR